MANLTPEDIFILLTNIRSVMQDEESALPDEALTSFMSHCSQRIGDAYFRTPRNTVTAFVSMLSILAQNPGVGWRSLIGSVDVAEDHAEDVNISPGDETDDELASFRL